jgi:surfeit locus 1 family protein
MTPALHSPRFWLLTAGRRVVAGTTFSLGQWQLRRAAQKEALQAAVDSKGRLPALDAQSLLAAKNIADDIHRPAVLKGVWRPEHTVYLDNRPMSGKTGFVVLTPLVLEGTRRPSWCSAAGCRATSPTAPACRRFQRPRDRHGGGPHRPAALQAL